MRIKILLDHERNDIPKEISFDTKIKIDREADIFWALRDMIAFMESQIVEDKKLV